MLLGKAEVTLVYRRNRPADLMLIIDCRGAHHFARNVSNFPTAAIFSRSGMNDVRNEFRAKVAMSLSVSPSACWMATKFSFTYPPKYDGSSELTVTSKP